MSGSRHPHGMAAMELSGNSTSCLGFGMAGNSALAWSHFFRVSPGDPGWMVEHPWLKWMMWRGYPPILGNLYIIYINILYHTINQ